MGTGGPPLTYGQIVARCAITESDCWEWQGSRGRSGYGTISRGGRMRALTRVVWEMVNDCTLPPEEYVLHKCDNPPCINPEHLFVGTKRDNTWDMCRKDRKLPRKLTLGQMRAIRDDSRPVPVVASEHAVHASTVYRIKRGKVGAWVD